MNTLFDQLMARQQQSAPGILGNLGAPLTMSDESQYPVLPWQQYAGGPKQPYNPMTGFSPLIPDPNQLVGSMAGPVGGGSRSGFRTLENIRAKTEQDGIKATLPKPRNSMEDLQFRTKDMSRDEILASEPLWAKARDLSNAQGISFSQAFRDLSNLVLRNKGAPVSDQEMTQVMMQAVKYGIK